MVSYLSVSVSARNRAHALGRRLSRQRRLIAPPPGLFLIALTAIGFWTLFGRVFAGLNAALVCAHHMIFNGRRTGPISVQLLVTVFTTQSSHTGMPSRNRPLPLLELLFFPRSLSLRPLL